MSPEYAAGRRSAIEDLFKLLPVEGEHFYYNEYNNYGCITFKWFCGAGDPAHQYRGKEQQGDFMTRDHGIKRRGTGRYFLNSDAVDAMLAALDKKPT